MSQWIMRQHTGLASAILVATLSLTGCGGDSSEVQVNVGTPVATGDVIALTSTGLLISFNRAHPDPANTPSDLISSKATSGYAGSDKLMAIDYRPSDSKLYGISQKGSIYLADPSTGLVTFLRSLQADPSDLSAPYAGVFTGDTTKLSMDFDPQTGRLRVSGIDGQNLSIDVDTGYTITDPVINLDAKVSSTAYDIQNGISHLYGINLVNNTLVAINPSNSTLVGTALLGIEADGTSGFDIDTNTHIGYAMMTNSTGIGFYKIDLTTINTNISAAILLGQLSKTKDLGVDVYSVALKPIAP
jgi:hypothetical protein